MARYLRVILPILSANTDIIVASAQAYLNALNRLHASTQQPTKTKNQETDLLAEQTVHA